MSDRVLELFHPAVQAWFRSAFAGPTAPQIAAWPAIVSGRHALVAAPTGSGKTLAAFLAAIDALVREGAARGARGRDARRLRLAAQGAVERHPEQPGGAARRHPRRAGGARAARRRDPHARAHRRHARRPSAQAMLRRPPHILVTTPESLYILLTSESGREMLRTTRTVIVDEIHALARDKRGAHLALSLERLDGADRTGAGAHRALRHAEADRGDRALPRTRAAGADARSSTPGTSAPRPRARAAAGAARGGDVGQRVAARSTTGWRSSSNEHRTTLVFVNTRRLAERVARHLAERLGDGRVDRASRQPRSRDRGSTAEAAAEARRAQGARRDRVARARASTSATSTWSVSSARRASIAAFLQRVGARVTRSAAMPKGRLFPLSRDELVRVRGARSIPCGGASSIASRCRRSRSTCSRSRSSPRSRARSASKTSCSSCSGAPSRTATSSEPSSTRRDPDARGGLRHPPRPAQRASASRRDQRRAARPRAARARRRSPPAVRFPTPPTTPCCSSRRAQLVGTVNEDFADREPARATCSSSATPPGGSCASSAGRCASRTRRARRRASRSGSAKRRRGARSCRSRCRGCARGIEAAPDRAAAMRRLGPAGRARRGGRGADRRLSRAPRTRRSARCRRWRRSCSSASSTNRAACSSSSMRRSAAGSIGPGGSRSASGSAAQFNFELQAAATEDAHHPVARDEPQLRARGCRAVPQLEDRAAAAGAGAARCADVRRALALERDGARWRVLRFRGGRKLPPQLAADAGRGPARRDLPRPGRLRGEPRRRRHRDPGPPAGRPDDRTTACTRRWTSTGSSACSAGSSAARSASSRASSPSRRRSPRRSSPRGPTLSSTTRRSRNVGRRR